MFSEILVIDLLLSQEKDANLIQEILFNQINGFYGTVMRQSFFSLFEKKANELIKNGTNVTELSKVYMENLKLQFGDSVDISEEFKWEWLSIPHFYELPFYVYAYAFGQLLVLALYQQYKLEGESFIPRYLDILKAGGSSSTIDILDKAGIDVRSTEFWQKGFNTITEMVDKLEKFS